MKSSTCLLRLSSRIACQKPRIGLEEPTWNSGICLTSTAISIPFGEMKNNSFPSRLHRGWVPPPDEIIHLPPPAIVANCLPEAPNRLRRTHLELGHLPDLDGDQHSIR